MFVYDMFKIIWSVQIEINTSTLVHGINESKKKYENKKLE